MPLLENPSMCVLILNYLSIREIKTAGSQRPPEEIRKGSDVIRRFMRRRFFPDDASMRGSAI